MGHLLLTRVRNTPHSLVDIKPELLQKSVQPLVAGNGCVFEESTQETVSEIPEEDESRELPRGVLPQWCIDELVEELHFISLSDSGFILKDILQSYFKKHNCEVDDMLISDMVTELCEHNPITSSSRSNDPLSTSTTKEESITKSVFSVVEPIEYLLSSREQRSF